MGAWGVASDQNDEVWDSVGLPLEMRTQGLSPLNITNHELFVKDVREEYPHGLPTGTIVWLLKMGCALTKEELKSGLDELNDELSSGESMFPRKVEERNKVVREEIEMISSAMNSDKGYADDKYLVGVLGIFQPHLGISHAPVRRGEDGKLVLDE